MKIAVVNLTSGGFSGGYRKYLKTLVPLIRDQRGVSAVDVFVPEQVVRDYEGWRSWPANDVAFLDLSRQVRDLKPDVVFIPTARWADFGGIPTVSMVRNMEPLEVPFAGNPWSEGARNIARAWVARHTVRRSDRVIAVSDHVRDFLVRRWSISPEKIGRVYHGVEAPPSRESLRRPDALAVLGDRKFIFTAGSVRPARGLEDVIGALPLIDRELMLVIAGNVEVAGRKYAQRLRRLAEKLGVGERIIWAGSLKAADISWCHYACEAFVMTTRAEACPNTALEAMSHGTLSISGDNAPMPEFFRTSARYYRLGDPQSLAANITATLTAPAAEQQRQRDEGRRRAADFTWEETAWRTVEELSKVVR